MLKTLLSAVLLGLVMAAPAPAQQTEPPDTLLAGITQRGQMLWEYYRAYAWGSMALDSVQTDPSRIVLNVVRRTPEGWAVRFGRFSARRDTFLVAYEATGASSSRPMVATGFPEPRASDARDLAAALAKTTARDAFGPTPRPYLYVAVPGPEEQWWVYVLPAQTRDGFYPHGRDVRYRISADGRTILETRLLHSSTVLEAGPPPPGTVMSTHTAVMDSVPEDTDVFYVLWRRPRLPEVIVTERHTYEIATDGSIIRRPR